MLELGRGCSPISMHHFVLSQGCCASFGPCWPCWPLKQGRCGLGHPEGAPHDYSIWARGAKAVQIRFRFGSAGGKGGSDWVQIWFKFGSRGAKAVQIWFRFGSAGDKGASSSPFVVAAVPLLRFDRIFWGSLSSVVVYR